jgi:hypothetical protein
MEIDKELVMRDDFTWTSKTKIISYLYGHSWVKNTLMATEKSEMNGCWDLNPIRKGFYYLKNHFVVFYKTKAT